MAEEEHTTNASTQVDGREFYGMEPAFRTFIFAKRQAFMVRMDAYLDAERLTSLAQVQSFETLQQAIQRQSVDIFHRQEIFRTIQEQDIQNQQQINWILHHSMIARQNFMENSHQLANFRKQLEFPAWLQGNKAQEQALMKTHERSFQMQNKSYQIHKVSFVAHVKSIGEQLTIFQAEMMNLLSEHEAFNIHMYAMILALCDELSVRLQHALEQPTELRTRLQEAVMFDLNNFLSIQLDKRIEQHALKNQQFDSMTYRQNVILTELDVFRTRQCHYQIEQENFRRRRREVLGQLETHLLADANQLEVGAPDNEKLVANDHLG